MRWTSLPKCFKKRRLSWTSSDRAFKWAYNSPAMVRQSRRKGIKPPDFKSPKTNPRLTQGSSEAYQVHPRLTQDSSKTHQVHPRLTRSLPSAPKTHPRLTQCTQCNQDSLKTHSRLTQCTQCTQCTQDSPEAYQVHPRLTQDSPKTHDGRVLADVLHLVGVPTDIVRGVLGCIGCIGWGES